MDSMLASRPAGKIAVVLTVKNEADDLLPWIAWYVSLGADTIFIFDDGSTDATFEMATLAGRAFDVRVKRTVQDGKFYTERQRDCYIEALRDNAREFDWIGFFDADEYLDLPVGTDLQSFLARGSDVGAVAINWCNYGSSGNVLRPYDHPFNAYVHHHLPHEDIGRHVKTFVRPSAWTGRWLNVHYFEITGHRYVDAVGKDVVWSHTQGVTENKATWQGARIMHYQCRSMEHFLDRIRKRPDLPHTTELWFNYDNNTVHSKVPEPRRAEVTAALRTMMAAASRDALALVTSEIPAVTTSPEPRTGWLGWKRRPLPAPVAAPVPRTPTPRLQSWRILSHDGCALRLDPHNNQVIADRPAGGDGNDDPAECQVLTNAGDDELAFLVLPGARNTAQIKDEIRVSPVLPFRLIRQGEGVAMQNATSHRFLSALPVVHGGTVLCDRFQVADWERFRLVATPGRLPAALRLDLLDLALNDPASFSRTADVDDILALFPFVVAFARPAVTAQLRQKLGLALRYLC